MPVSRGVAIGRAVLVASSRVDVAHYFVAQERVPAEVERLRHARDTVASELAALQRDLPDDAPPELSALLDVHLMLLHDEALTGATKALDRGPALQRRMGAVGAAGGAGAAVRRDGGRLPARAQGRSGAGRRAHAACHVARARGCWPCRSAGALGARDFAGEDPLVLVANDVAPADMMRFKRSVFTGFVTDVGGRTSHTAIVARSMDIPAVVGAREASRLIRPGRLGGDRRRCRHRASSIRRRSCWRSTASGSARASSSARGSTGCATRRRSRSTGRRVELLANIEQPGDAAGALRGRRGRRGPVSQRVPVHEPRRRPAGRGRAVRGLPRRGDRA